MTGGLVVFNRTAYEQVCACVDGPNVATLILAGSKCVLEVRSVPCFLQPAALCHADCQYLILKLCACVKRPVVVIELVGGQSVRQRGVMSWSFVVLTTSI